MSRTCHRPPPDGADLVGRPGEIGITNEARKGPALLLIVRWTDCSVVAATRRTEYSDRKPSHSYVRRAAYQGHGAGTRVRRQRRERVIDLEVTGGRQQDAGAGRTMLDKGSHGFTDQGGNHRKCGRRRPSGVIPTGQNQPFSFNLDAPIRTHRRIEIVDHPDLASRQHVANYVAINRWRGHCGWWVCVRRVCDAGCGRRRAIDDIRNGMDPYPALNFNPPSSAAAGSEQATPSNIVHAKVFLIMILPPF
jgi:hypothetical protein